MGDFFFSGAHSSKLDEKNRFVLPQSMRYGLVENGALQFTLGLGLGGCLSIYRRSEIEALVLRLKPKIHIVKYRRFFTLFFSTLHHTSCDKLGRVLIPTILKRAAKIDQEVIIAGVLNKIEVWSREKYEFDLDSFLSEGDSQDMNLLKMTEEILTSVELGPKEREVYSGDESELSYLGDERGSDSGF
ncbi:MAG: hypothetical protein K9M07_04320 [Simkaniaceae bacterium]|nr:hypothetical protein [Simkaniaceae bacterium]MCF7852449.1 hypothetical protein [Simkaniaceae bacterium]